MKLSLINISLICIIIFNALRLIFFNINPAYSADEAIYISIARSLYNNLGYGYLGYENIESYRAPVFPVLLYILYLIFGFSETVTQLFVPVISVISIAIFYYFAKGFLSRELSLLATLFFATNHLVLFFTFRVMSENLLVLLFIATFYLFFKSFRDRRFLIPFFVVLALTLMTKYTTVTLLPSLLIFMLVFQRKSLLGWVKNKWFYLGMLAFVLTLLPWIIYTKDIFGNPLNAVFYHWYAGSSTPRLFSYTPIRFFLLTPFAIGLVTPFMLYGVYAFLKNRKEMLLWFLLIFIAVTLIVESLVLASLRYVSPLVPFFGIFAAYGLTKIRSRKKKLFLKRLFIIFSIINALVGFGFIMLFTSGLQGKLPEFISRGTYFSEHLQNKEASAILKENTIANETIMTNNYPLTWLYTERRWVDMPTDEDIFWKKLEENDIRYVYLRVPSAPREFLKTSDKLELVYDKEFVKIYKVKP